MHDHRFFRLVWHWNAGSRRRPSLYHPRLARYTQGGSRVKRLNWILLLTAVGASVAEARPRRVNTVMTYPSPAVVRPVYTPPTMSASPVMAQPMTGGGLAQQKAQTQAQAGRCYHPGGSLGGGTHEGCGFSSVSADDAIRHCCYWGQRTPIDIGVARGANGWYATVLYR
jgi:hypothetical protein